MTGRLLGAAGAVVVALLVGLWFTIQDDAVAEAPPARGTTIPVPPAEAAPAPAAPPAPAPSARTTVIRPRAQPLPANTAPSAAAPTAPAVAGSAQEVADATRMFHRSLDEQIGLSEPHLVECVERALKSGAKVDGTTAVSFTIAKQKNGKLGIETTGIEYSSIPDQRTTDCIRDVGKGLTFDELPEGVERVLAFRKVVVADGKITENWLTEFAQNPVQAPPRN